MEKRSTSIDVKWQRNLRIIWAIALKDVLDAIRSRTALFSVVGVVGCIAIIRMALSWVNAGEAPDVFVYDAGRSALAVELQNGVGARFHVYPSYTAWLVRRSDRQRT